MAADFGLVSTQIADSVNTVFQAIDTTTRGALEITALANRMAVDTGQNIEVITDLLVAAKNAYKLNNEELERVGGRMIQTWIDGVVTLEELHTSLGRVFQATSLFGAKTEDDLNRVFASNGCNN